MKEALRLAAPLLALLVLAGCASSSGLVKNASPIATNKLVSLDFILVETSSSLGDLEGEKRLLKNSIILGLKETGLFENVSGNVCHRKRALFFTGFFWGTLVIVGWQKERS